MVSATFAADLTDFFAKFEKADQKVRTLATTSTKTGDELSKLEKRFSGQGLIRSAIDSANAIDKLGGTSILTGKELQQAGAYAQQAAEKMNRLGVEVPANVKKLADAVDKPIGKFQSLLGVIGKIAPALGVGLSVGAITSFARGVGQFSGELIDLSAQTSISTKRLQGFNLVAAGAGLSLDDVTGSADQLARRIGAGDDSVVSALGRMHLKVEDLKDAKLDDVMFQIDKSLQGVGNQFDRARILSDLFGRSGAQLGRIMDGSLKEVTKAAEESGGVIDEKLLTAADRFDDAWSKAWILFRAHAVNAIGGVGDAIDSLWRDLSTRFPGLGGFGSQRSIEAAAAAFAKNNPSLKPLRSSGFGPDSSIVEGAGIKGVLPESELSKELRKWKEETAKAAEATKRWAENLQSQFTIDREAAFFNAPTSAATKKLQALLSRAGTPGILPNFSQSRGLTAGLMFGPADISGRAQGGAISKLSQSFLGGLSGGFKNLLEGFTGGGGTGGFLSKLGGALVGGIGNTLGGALTGGISSLIGFGISGLGKLFGGLFKNEGKQTNRERDAKIAEITGISGDKFGSQEKFREMATAAGVANAELDRLFSTKKTKEFETALDSVTRRIDAFTSEQEADQERLTKAIEKYGLTFEQLGSKFQQTELNKQAKELIEDWRVLIDAGVEITDVNNAMSAEINKYLQTALKLGTEVPNAFKPILQKMADQGTLTDEAGNAITDLEGKGIKFSETWTEGFDKVVKKLDELIAKLGIASIQLGSMPAVPEVPASIIDPGSYSQSDLIPAPGFAQGTSGRYLNFGSGTPVLLHGRERVMTEAEGAAQATQWSAMVDEVRALRSDFRWIKSTLPIVLRDAMLLAR